MATLSYPKSVRLHYRKAFLALLESGNTHYNAVFKVFWKASPVPGANPGQTAPGCSRFAVSVPKRSFKRAVKRNLLKRRTREAIRLNRSCLPEGFTADFLFFYRPAEVLEFDAIEKEVIEAFTSIAAKAAAMQAPAPDTALNESRSDE